MGKYKLNRVIVIIGSITILTIVGLVFNGMYKNHQVNKLIIEECFEQLDIEREVTLKKDGIWSPVICEKN